jgi:tetratricopeptide (TPR) repeat protein
VIVRCLLPRVAASVIAGALAVSLSAAPERCAAQSIEGGMPRAGEASWGDYLDDDDRRRARDLRRQGLVLLLQAIVTDPDPTGPAPQPLDVQLDRALLRFVRARRALPRDPDLLYFIARALAMWRREEGGREERRTEEAVAAYGELRSLDPDYHADHVAFELAILHSRSGDHGAAIAEYRRALEVATDDPSPLHYIPTAQERRLASLFQPISVATVHLNLAENTMLVGDLEAAVESYRRASALTADDPFGRALALWGLALALDRSGDHPGAIASAQRAIEGDPFPLDMPALGVLHGPHGPMALLHSDLVFFEPGYEIHAYDAIGREAMARSATAGAARREQLESARDAWRRYLVDGGNAGIHAEHARRALARIEAELGGAPASPPPRRGEDASSRRPR